MKNELKNATGPKYRQLSQVLRERIAARELAPGSRLPTWDALIEQTGFSRVTVGRALNELQEDGFLESRGKLGTFVADCPPCESKVALVFPHYTDVERPGGIHLALLAAARERMAQGPLNVTLYNLSLYDHHSAKLADLLTASAARMLGGAICVNHESDEVARALVERGLPVVSVFGSETAPARTTYRRAHGACIVYDMEQFRRRACAWAAARRAGSAAVIGYTAPEMHQWGDELARHAIATRPHWLLTTGAEHANAGKFVHLLFDRPDKRPGALIVADDTLVEPTTEALAELGLSVPVLVLANWPAPPQPAVPVTLLGYDMGAALDLAVAAFRKLRTGGDIPAPHRLPAHFALTPDHPDKGGRHVPQMVHAN